MDDESQTFSQKMNNVALNGFFSLGLAMGTDFGLFEALCKFDRPASTKDIAEAANCKERYVHEWLCFMSAGKVVDTSEDGKTFFLPPSHRAALVGPGLIKDFLPFLPSLIQSHSALAAAFQKNGPPGIPHEVNAPLLAKFEKSRPQQFTRQLPKIVKCIPGLQEDLERGIEVCEVGCGRGHLIHVLATNHPNSKFTGIDISGEAVKDAKEMASDKMLQNVMFYLKNAEEMPKEWTQKFDLVIMYDVLHDLPHASKAACEFFRILKNNGQLIVLDIDVSSDTKRNVGNLNALATYPFSLYHCMSTSLSVPESEGLGSCVGVEKLASILKGGGFLNVTTKSIHTIAPGMALLHCNKQDFNGANASL